MKFETVDDRCKFYEKNYFSQRLMPGLPILCRSDGKAFHSFTKGLERPFDSGLSDLMINTTKYLVKETNANWGYVQSDEISLGFYSENKDEQLFFDGKAQKIVSLTAAMATYFFNKNLADYVPRKTGQHALFDSRCWNVPDLAECVVYAKWRQKDATKNAITMAASSVYSHNELQGVNGSVKQEMLYRKGINFNDYEARFKRGTFVRRTRREIPFTAEEIENLPLKHEARKNPSLTVNRNVIGTSTIQLSKVGNPEEFLFYGAEPSVLNNRELINGH